MFLLAAFLHFVELASQKSLAWLIVTICFLEFLFYVSLLFHYLERISIYWKANKAMKYSFSLFNDDSILILMVFIDFKLEYTLHLYNVVAKQFFYRRSKENIGPILAKDGYLNKDKVQCFFST